MLDKNSGLSAARQAALTDDLVLSDRVNQALTKPILRLRDAQTEAAKLQEVELTARFLQAMWGEDQDTEDGCEYFSRLAYDEGLDEEQVGSRIRKGRELGRQPAKAKLDLDLALGVKAKIPAVPRVIMFDDIENTPKEHVVEGLLGAGEISALFGAPGSGKSVLAQDIGLHIAAHMKWHGRVVKGGAVLYVALERPAVVKRRALAFRIKHGVRGLPFGILPGGLLDLRDQKAAAAIVAAAHALTASTGQPVVLIIIDTVSRGLCGGDENSPRDMGAFVNSMTHICQETGAHVMGIHHVPHESNGRLRGHGSLEGAIDTGIFVTKDAASRSAIVRKASDGEEGLTINFRLEIVKIPDTKYNPGGAQGAQGVLTPSAGSAPVVIPAEAQGAQGFERRVQLTDKQRRFVDITRNAILDAGTVPTDTSLVPAGIRAITRDMLKRYLIIDGYMSEPQDKVEASRARALQSEVLNALAGKGVLGLVHEWVWVP
jgi:hypothetical protein